VRPRQHTSARLSAGSDRPDSVPLAAQLRLGHNRFAMVRSDDYSLTAEELRLENASAACARPKRLTATHDTLHKSGVVEVLTQQNHVRMNINFFRFKGLDSNPRHLHKIANVEVLTSKITCV